MTARPHNLPSTTRGFTLIELLVVIAILALLIGLVFVALLSARHGSERTVTLGALRQIMTGYSGYSAEHSGVLLPGYIRPAQIGNSLGGSYNPQTQLDLRALNPARVALNSADTSGYVWRLAPYLDYGYDAFLSDYSDATRSRFADEFAQSIYGPGSTGPSNLGAGFVPAIGYNSIYLGGDNFHGDGWVPTYSPWGEANPNVREPTVAATRTSEVLYPAHTIVFAACKAVNMTLPQSAEQLGYVELRPPWVPGADPGSCDKPQWIVDDQNQLQPNPANFTGPGGLMVDRRGKGDQVPTAHFDGSVFNVNPMTFFHDRTLTAQGERRAIDRIIAQWSPRFAAQSGNPGIP